MWLEEYATTLKYLLESNILGKFLTPETEPTIQSKAAELRDLAKGVRRTNKHHKRWNFEIPMQNPISFIVNSDWFQVDISSTIIGIDEDISEVNSLLRVW